MNSTFQSEKSKRRLKTKTSSTHNAKKQKLDNRVKSLQIKNKRLNQKVAILRCKKCHQLNGIHNLKCEDSQRHHFMDPIDFEKSVETFISQNSEICQKEQDNDANPVETIISPPTTSKTIPITLEFQKEQDNDTNPVETFISPLSTSETSEFILEPKKEQDNDANPVETFISPLTTSETLELSLEPKKSKEQDNDANPDDEEKNDVNDEEINNEQISFERNNETTTIKKGTFETMLKCDKCDSKFSKVCDMVEHYNYKHATKKDYDCSHCNTYGFQNHYELLLHVELKHYKQTSKKHYDCFQCNLKGFDNYQGLLLHVEYKHTQNILSLDMK